MEAPIKTQTTNLNAAASPVRSRRPILLAAIAVFAAATAAAIPVVFTQFPQTNPAGGSLMRASAAVSSFAEQTNSRGARLQVIGLENVAVESHSATGAILFAGQFSGEVRRNVAGAEWTMYEEK